MSDPIWNMDLDSYNVNHSSCTTCIRVKWKEMHQNQLEDMNQIQIQDINYRSQIYDIYEVSD